MLLTLIAVLVVLWLVGVAVHIGGGLIHLLLIVALIAFIYHITVSRRDV